MMIGFLAENPDCAERMARYGVTMMKERGVTANEVREHLEDMKRRGLLPGVDIDAVLEA